MTDLAAEGDRLHTDLLARLRRLRATAPANSPTDRICRDAAVALDALRARCATAEAALRLACADTGFDVDDAVEHYTAAAVEARHAD